MSRSGKGFTALVLGVLQVVLATMAVSAAAQVSVPPLGPPLFPGSYVLVDVDHVAVADIDNDGWPDWAGTLAQGAGSELVVARNNGRGKFHYEKQTLGEPPSGLALGDVDGDGRPDAVILQGSASSVAVLTGDDLGHFPAPAVVSPAGIQPAFPSLGDFDLDGDLDLLHVAAQSGGVVLVCPNTGGGTFGAPVPYPAVSGVATAAVASDVTGDGAADAVVLGSAGDVVTLPGGSAGGLGSAQPVGSFSGAILLRLGDVNGDGLSDVAVYVPTASALDVVVAAGSGMFQSPFPLIIGTTALDVTLGDANGDGRDDVVVAQAAGTLVTYPSAADGQPGATVVMAIGDPAPTLIAALDADLDGHDDVLGLVTKLPAGPDGMATVWGNEAAGGFGTGTEYPSSLLALTDFRGIALGDLTGDGDLDVVGSMYWNAVMEVWPGDGHGGLGASTLYGMPNGTTLTGLAVGDVDADGDVDVLLADATGGSPLPDDFALAVMANLGGGALEPPREVPGIKAPASLALADMNGDGTPDVLVPDTFAVFVALGGVGGLGPMKKIGKVDEATDIAAGDLDLDGDLDVVVTSATGLTALWNAGVGGQLEETDVSDGYLFSPAIADIDEDGLGDIVAILLPTHAVHVQLGQPGHGFAPVASPPIPAGSAHLLLADLDGDGHVDLAAAMDAPPALGIVMGDGNGGFGEFHGSGLDSPGRRVALGDLNADGSLDAVLGTKTPVAVFLNGHGADPWGSVGGGLPGAFGLPQLDATGSLQPGAPTTISLTEAAPLTPALLVIGTGALVLPFKGGTLVPDPNVVMAGLVTDAGGSLAVSAAWPAGVPPHQILWMQAWLPDTGGPEGWAASGTMVGVAP